MKISVQLEDGRMFETVAKSSHSLEAVKESVALLTGVAPEKQKIFFGGRELENADTLAHSLWEALKKVSRTQQEGKIDLKTVKAMCSPASSPNRGMSPTRSYSALDPMGCLPEGLSTEAALQAGTRDTLSEAAELLGRGGARRHKGHSSRSISPERRAAVARAAVSSMDEGVVDINMLVTSASAVAEADTADREDSGSPQPHAPAPGEQGFEGYNDDMIL